MPIQKEAFRSFFPATLIFFSFFFSSTSFALDLFVDRDSLGGACDDQRGRAQVTRQTPWCSLGTAGMEAIAGDTVWVRQGIYNGTQICGACRDAAVLEVLNNGEADAWIRFLEEPGEQVILDGTNGPPDGILVERPNANPVPPPNPVAAFVEIDGFEIRNFRTQLPIGFGNCVMVDNVSDVLLRNLKIHGCTYNAMEIQKTDRVTLEYSSIYDNHLAGWTSPVDLFECGKDNVVRGNFIWDNTDEDPENRESEGHGIIVDICGTESSALIENNVIWNNEGWCITVLKSNGVTMRNNTCWHNGLNRPDSTGEIVVLGDDMRVYNNILVPQEDRRIALYMRDPEAPDYPVDLITSEVDGNLIWAPDSDIPFGFANNLFLTIAEYRDDFTLYPWGASVIEADPLLIDPLGGNFRLLAGSMAIDSSIEAQTPALDIEQRARPTDGDGDDVARSDRGAYEFVPTTDDVAPEAVLSADVTSGQAPLSVSFDAGESSDDVAIVTYSFDFGDGEQNPNAADNISHTYTEDGNYTVTLTVFDAAGNADAATVTITVATDPTDSEPPVANLLANPVTGNVPLTVNFDASASSDNVGISDYTFVFDDPDGNSSSGQTANASFTYVDEGTYNVQVTVSDAAGNQASASVVVNVTTQPADNTPPAADLNATPLTGVVPLTVEFDASGSTDNVAVAGYAFDFDGTGSTPQDPAAVASFTYTEAGDYIATVTVFDEAGNSDLASVAISVAPDSGSEPPTSMFTAAPLSGDAPLSVMFDGSASTDDVGITIYRFDFGDFSGTYSTESMVQHTYSTPGTFQVALQVFDADGNSDFTKITITVTEPPPVDTESPLANLTADPPTGEAPLVVNFDASASSDNVAIVDFRFDFGDGADTAGAQDNASHTYNEAGSYLATLTVTDAAGNATTASLTINVDDGGGTEQEIVLQQGLNGYSGTRDTYLASRRAGVNYGNARVLRERAEVFAVLLKFAIFESQGGPVPDGATIESATLSIYKYSTNGQEYRAQRLLTSWDEHRATWIHRQAKQPWTVPGAMGLGSDIAAAESATTSVGNAAGQWVDLDVTAGTQAFAGGATNQGWRVIAVSGNSHRVKRFRSSEYPNDPTLRPKLSLVYRAPGG